jgi:hypothetical protein
MGIGTITLSLVSRYVYAKFISMDVTQAKSFKDSMLIEWGSTKYVGNHVQNM